MDITREGLGRSCTYVWMNQTVISASLTDHSIKDNEVFEEMLEGLESKVSQVSGDGAYDAWKLWNYCEFHGIKGIFEKGQNKEAWKL